MATAKSHLKKRLETAANQHQEDLAREQRNYGRIRHPEEQTGIRRNLWKSWSRVRFPSTAFRDGYDQVNWSDEPKA